MTYVNPPDTSLRVTFPSGSGSCAAWLTCPGTPPPWPAVVLAHGLGATRPMALPHYEQAFSRAGIAVLSFDYRHLGASPGEPRQLISVRRQVEDLESAVAFTRAHADIDADRVALWGTSFGAAHVVTVATRDQNLAAAVVQCPIIDGLDAARRLGIRGALAAASPIAHDLVCRATGRRRPTVRIVGEPSERALVTTPGAASGWASIMPEGYDFDNRTTPSVALEMLRYRPVKHANEITCPFLVVVSTRETLMNPEIAADAARSAPRGESIAVDADHFDVYHEPLLSELLHHETRFLHRHLAPSVPSESGLL